MPFKRLASKGKSKMPEIDIDVEAIHGEPTTKKRSRSNLRRNLQDDCWGDENRQRLEEYRKLSVLPSRWVFFEHLAMAVPLLVDLLDHQSLRKFLELESPCYENLVKRFYANLKQDDQDKDFYLTRVNGIEMSLSPKTFLQFGLHDEGLDLYNYNFRSLRLTKKQVLMELVGGEEAYNHLVTHKQKITTYTLPFLNRVMLGILTNSLMMKLGHRDEIKDNAAIAMYLIHDKVEINWARFLFNTMVHSSKKSLPYGNLVSFLMIQNQVDVSKESSIPQKAFDVSSISRISVGSRSAFGLSSHTSHEDQEDRGEAHEEGGPGGGYEGYDAPNFSDQETLHFGMEELSLRCDRIESVMERVDGKLDHMMQYLNIPPYQNP